MKPVIYIILREQENYDGPVCTEVVGVVSDEATARIRAMQCKVVAWEIDGDRIGDDL